MICLLRVLKNLKKLIKKTNSAVDEALIKKKKDNSTIYNCYTFTKYVS